jgi:hypothetical protein
MQGIFKPLPGKRYSAILEDIDPARGLFTVSIADSGRVPVFLHGFTFFSSDAATRLREMVLHQAIEVEFRGADGPPFTVDIWYLEPITEDGEVEFAAFRSIVHLLAER